MRSGTTVVAVSSGLAALWMVGCRPASDPDVARGTIGPAGGFVSSIDNVLTIAVLPDALDETIELTIVRSDEPPEIYGPAYRVQPNVALAVPATVTYRYALPDDTSAVAVGYVDADEFQSGRGRWRPLALANLDPAVGLVTGIDPEISLFYGLLDDAVDVPPAPTTGETATDGMTGDADSGTTGDPTAGDTGTTVDPSAGPTTNPGDTSDGTTDTGDETTTGVPDVCETIPPGPLPVVEFMFTGTPLDANAEDMTFSSIGSLIVRNGADLVQITPGGNVTVIPTAVALPDTLGLRWTTAGNIVTASLTTNEILQITPAGAVTSLWGGLGIPNGIYPAIDGNVFFTDFAAPLAGYIDAGGTMFTELGAGGIEAPQANGIVYDPDRALVYYVSYGQGLVWRVDVSDLANPAPPENILTIGPLNGDAVGLDGLAMDECGNLYVVDQNQDAAGSLYRVFLDPTGDPIGDAEVLVEAFPDGVANAVFAQGPGWEAMSTNLFLVGLPGRIFRVDVGVQGAPTAVTG